MSLVLKGIQPAEVDDIWPSFWPLLARAEEYNAGVPITERDSKLAMKEGRVQGWACINNGDIVLAFSTTIYDTPTGKTLEIVAVGGNGVDDWLWCLDRVAEWGQSLGCKRLLTSGRKGWTKVLSKAGFKTVAYVNERVI
jgi:hypothetical protein